MEIPEGFQYSSSSLQDFEDCRFRFWLRYLRQVDWPAVQSEPAMEAERRMQSGARFHQMAQAFFAGVPGDKLASLLQEPEQRQWWANFLEHLPASLPPASEHSDWFTEVQLSAPLKGRRLLAKMDFICRCPDGKWVIFDWKTNLKLPSRAWLQKSLQTRLYPYLLVRASAALNQHQPITADSVSMTYWFPAFPGQPETFEYSSARYELDQAYLSEVIAIIERLDESEFVKTGSLESCRFCVYRSFCDRGTVAGEATEISEESPEGASVWIDFDQIPEISF